MAKPALDERGHYKLKKEGKPVTSPPFFAKVCYWLNFAMKMTLVFIYGIKIIRITLLLNDNLDY